MKTTIIVYDYNTASTISKTEVCDGHFDIIGYLVRSLYPNETALCINIDDIQINIELEYKGWSVEYTVTIENKNADEPCEVRRYEDPHYVTCYIYDYIGNKIRAERA